MKSIKFKIMLGLVLVISIPVALVFAFLYHDIYQRTIDGQTDAIRREIRQLDNAMTIFMDQAKYNVTLLGTSPLMEKVDGNLTSYVDTREKTMKVVPRGDDATGQAITTLFKRMQETHPAYVEVYFGSEQGGFVSSVEGGLPVGYDPRKRPWYQDALATPDKPAISKAYMSTTGEAVVGVAQVVSRAGKNIGAVGLDISLKVLTDIVKAIKIGQTGYVVFVQGDGVVISNPRNPEQNFKKISELGIPGLQKAFSLERGDTVVTMGGTRYLALCHTAPKLGWKFVTFVAYDEVVGPIQSLMWWSGLAIAVILIFICGVISVFLGKEIFKPLTRIIGQLRAIGAGRYDARLTVRRKDEIGQVYDALNQTTATLEANLGEIEAKRTEAERTAREAEEARQQAEEARRLAEEAKVEGMLHAATQLKDVVGIVSTASTELSAQIEEASRGSEHQAGRINEAATAMEEMSASVIEIAKNAGNTATLAEKTKSAAAEGKTQMEQVKTDVDGIHQGFRQVYDSVSDLSSKADGIGSIAQTIEDIADQTNLLALNAAIEAARAGEAGRGFAVVADEVRKLAEKTMTATKEVGQAVSGIQTGVSGTLTGMDRTKQIIEQSLGQTAQASSGLGTILGLVVESSDQVRGIATAAEQQSTATEDINRNIEEINVISTETADAMREAAKAVSDLAEQAVVLQDLIRSLEDQSGRKNQAALPR
ncbi:methyl-accepting chemotaxis sensory transducer with Cache sensor [Solidesulfovibrio fructosivorans JJ]]|uniref:Methyl-accepting chemotaxis sensory transducer with Cache sensor n=1 Tax=Solidesulfovibrio fructosivorans JJ] TaxID=596151 RepID=E1K1N7_SOLFR|nr:methyl-accepting chemotaxis protein [Solidesulfovibrio fructosivorans]EFL49475.1 methyl-accepting chemotaxis sensory transducer with Cache sensor [Solidesulfovibrio fructosivorans JJ]]